MIRGVRRGARSAQRAAAFSAALMPACLRRRVASRAAAMFFSPFRYARRFFISSPFAIFSDIFSSYFELNRAMLLSQLRQLIHSDR